MLTRAEIVHKIEFFDVLFLKWCICPLWGDWNAIGNSTEAFFNTYWSISATNLLMEYLEEPLLIFTSNQFWALWLWVTFCCMCSFQTEDFTGSVIQQGLTLGMILFIVIINNWEYGIKCIVNLLMPNCVEQLMFGRESHLQDNLDWVGKWIYKKHMRFSEHKCEL